MSLVMVSILPSRDLYFIKQCCVFALLSAIALTHAIMKTFDRSRQACDFNQSLSALESNPLACKARKYEKSFFLPFDLAVSIILRRISSSHPVLPRKTAPLFVTHGLDKSFIVRSCLLSASDFFICFVFTSPSECSSTMVACDIPSRFMTCADGSSDAPILQRGNSFKSETYAATS